MLLGLQVEPWRPRPSKLALVRARPSPGPSRLKVFGSLPTLFRAEDRAEILHPMVQGARPAGTAPLVGVVRIAEEVVIAVGLFGQLGHVAMVAMDRAESPGPVGIEVQLALPGRDQFRERFPAPAGSSEPVQRQPGRHVQPTDAWDRAQQGVGVGGHRVRMADQFDDPRVTDEGKPPRRALQEWLESRLVRSDRGAGVLPRNAVDPSRVGVQLVAAEHYTSRL